MGSCWPQRRVAPQQHRVELAYTASSSAGVQQEVKPVTIWLLRPRDLEYVPTGTVIWSIDGDRLVAGIDQVEQKMRFGGYLAVGLSCSKWTREELGRLLDIPSGVARVRCRIDHYSMSVVALPPPLVTA